MNPQVETRLTEFSELIDSFSIGFVGREWLVEQVEDLFDDPDCRFIVLTGSAGVGKSALMAHLAKNHPEWPRYFIRRDSRELLRPGDAKTFLLTIGGQLATLHPELFKPERLEVVVRQRIGDLEAKGEAVAVRIKELQASPFYGVAIRAEQEIQRMAGKATGVEIGRLIVEPRGMSMQDLQCLGLLDPAWLLYQTNPEARIVVLVDALDELRYSPAEEDLLRALCEMPVGLTNLGGPKVVSSDKKLPGIPPNLRFVVTSRREKFLDRLLGRSDAHELQLAVESKENRADLWTYAHTNLPSEELESVPAQEKTDREEFLTDLLGKAAGNFLYLRSVLDAIREALADAEKGDRLRSLLRVKDLPDDLDALYDYFLASIVDWVKKSGFGEAAWRQYLRPLLGTLAVAHEPLSEEQLMAFTGLESEDLGDLLRELRQFVEPVVGRQAHRIYHTSFAEYLLDAKANEDYRIDGRKWHGRIAGYYVNAWGGLEASLPGLQDAAVRDVHGGYGLRQLAAHLDGANRTEELHKLISQAWMAERFEGSNYTYDGFIDDVMLAWQAAHEEALAQIEAGRAPAELAHCVRYALIRTSINSLSASYVPALVARAVETGLREWPVERALSVANRVPAPGERVDMFSALLATGKLNDEQSSQAQKAGLEAALAIGDEGGRARALAALAPQLEGDLLAQGLEAAQAIEQEGPRAEALAALAPQLTGKALEQGLEAALAIGDEYWRAHALAALAPKLAGEALERGLEAGWEAVLAIESPYDLATALAGLIPVSAAQLTGKPLEPLLAPVLTIADKGIGAEALAALAPHMTGEALEQVLAGALNIADEKSRAEALAALAPQLSGEALKRVVAAALTIADERSRAEALTALAPQLTGEARTEVLGRALAAAQAIADEGFRAEALAALAPQLADETLGQALAAALALTWDGPRAVALAALAPQLTGALLAQGLNAALAIEDEVGRAKVLAALAPQLTGELLSQGLESALAIGHEGYRVNALEALAPQLAGEALERRLAAALAIKDERFRAKALASLAPQLTGEARSQALGRGLAAAVAVRSDRFRAEALATLAPQLTGEARSQALELALEAVLAVRSEVFRSEALAALAPQLTGEALEQGLAAALAIGYGWARAQALEALAPQLTGELLERGLESALAIRNEEYRAYALAGLAPQITGDLLERALAAAFALEDEKCRARALASLAPQLTGEARSQALGRGLEAAMAIEDEWWQAEVLSLLAPQLKGEERTRALAGGLEAALSIADIEKRALALGDLAPQLAGEALERALAGALAFENEWKRQWTLSALVPHLQGSALRRALAGALAIENDWYRAQALTAFLPLVPDPPPLLRRARQAVAEHLKTFSSAERSWVLLFCAQEGLFAPPVLDQDTLAAIAGHIVEVCEEWRWM